LPNSNKAIRQIANLYAQNEGNRNNRCFRKVIYMSKQRIVRLVLIIFILGVIGAMVFYFTGRLPKSEDVAETTPLPAANKEAIAAKASAGDHQAELQMGLLELDAARRPDDYRRAEEWLRKSAEAGLAEAQYRLGTLYQSGRVTEPVKTNALYWFEKAAAQHHMAALFNLGSMYGMGEGVAKNPQLAVRYFREAAEMGDGYAQFNLGRRYLEGQGIATNLVEAWKWFDLAESGGIEGVLDKKRNVEARLTPAELDQARKAAEEVRKQLPRLPATK
jgi:TPR repeat protein